MIRIVWSAFIAGLALVAASAQLDRQSRIDHALAPIVPAPFRSFAQQVMVDIKLVQGNPEEALAEAATLVRRRPVPAENLLGLTLAQQAAGENQAAIRSLTLAGRRGWRCARLQELQLRIAMIAGDPQEAANRLAALWAVDGDGRDLTEPTRLVLASEDGRKLFASRIAGTRLWQNSFLRGASAMVAPEVFAQTTGAAALAGAQFDCELLSNAARGLAGKGRIAPARAMWTGSCANTASPAIAHGGFNPDEGAPQGPLDWHYPDEAMIDRYFQRSAGAWAMDYESRESVSGLLAQRYLALAPGRHSLTITSDGGSGELAVRLSCIGDAARPVRLASRRGEGALAFDVPLTACTAQQLSLTAERGSREGLRVMVD